jgi:hypothetical protein
MARKHSHVRASDILKVAEEKWIVLYLPVPKRRLTLNFANV